MDYLKIQNDGVIDPYSFHLIGASTKRADNSKIGFFGSGLKYAMAYLLRHEKEIKIYSGTKEIVVTTKAVDFRGQQFNQIYIDGVQTSFTTEMGPDWKAWFALREIYCNALDELGSGIEIVKEAVPNADKTQFYIGLDDEYQDIVTNFKSYFSKGRKKKFEKDYGAVVYEPLNDDRSIIYRKGINVCETSKRGLYDYDFDTITINESRVAAEYEVKMKIVDLFINSKNVEFIKSLLNQNKSYEFTFDWDYWHTPTEEWITAIDGRVLVVNEVSGHFSEEILSCPENYVILPASLVKKLKEHFGDRVNILGGGRKSKYIELPMGDKEKRMLEEVKGFAKQAGLDKDFEVLYAELDKYGFVRGEAIPKEKLMYLAPAAFKDGKRTLLKIYAEEYLHIETGLGDKTRHFQDYLIDMFVTAKEKELDTYL